MAASKEVIRGWLAEAKKQKATHMIVACDSNAYADYPVFVPAGTDPKAEVARLGAEPMQRVIEVYSLALPIEPQLAKYRAFQY